MLRLFKYPRKLAWSLLFLTLVLTTLAGWLSSYQKLDSRFDKFLPPDDPGLVFYRQFQDTFGTENDFLLLAVANKPSVFQADFLQKINKLSNSLENLPNINHVLSPTSLQLRIVSGVGVLKTPLLHWEEPALLSKDSAYILSSEEYVHTLFAANSQSLSLLVGHEDDLDEDATARLLNSVDSTLQSLDFQEYHYSGKKKIEATYLSRLLGEMGVFFLASLVLVIIVLVLSFRAFWAVWAPILSVLFAVAWSIGFMTLLGKDIDLLMTLLPTFVFVVGMSDVIHLVAKYLEELRNGHQKVQALYFSIKEVGFATFLTSATTAAGFATLVTASVIPVRDFGFYTAVGVMLAYVLTFLFMPAILLLMPTPKIAKKKSDSVIWTRILRSLFLVVSRRRSIVLLSFAGIVVLSVIGLMQMKVNRYFLEDLHPSDPLKMDHAFFEENFYGIKPFELVLDLGENEGSFLDLERLREMESISVFLQENYDLGAVVSPATYVKAAWKANNDGSPEYFALPPTEKELKKVAKQIRVMRKRGDLSPFLSKNGKLARISGKGKDIGSYPASRLNAQVDSMTQALFKGSGIQATRTGAAMLVDQNNETITSTLLWGLFIAFLAVGILAGILLKSLTMVIVSLIPNVIPLLMVGGLMGWMGFDLKINTAIVFVVAFGIAVDDTIHLLSKLRFEISKGKSLAWAMRRTYMSTGKAIILTSVVLSAGFMTLVLSSFQSSFTTGLMVSLSLLFALITDLLLLPVLMFMFYRGK